MAGSSGAGRTHEPLTVRQERAIMREVRAAALAAPEPAPEPTAETVTERSPGGTVWDRPAECESHGQWDYNERSGWGSGIYDGGLQFDPGTWLAFGGGDYAPTADRATPLQQIEVAERTLAAQGWVAWPACSLELGLR